MTCAPTSNGQAPGGGDPDAFSLDVTTTDATVQTAVLAQLPNDGAAATIELDIAGFQTGPAAADAGDRGGWFHVWVNVARNSIGTNFLIVGVIGPSGYTDIATAPWNTVAPPAGWNLIGLAIVGTSLVLNFNAAAGQTVQWRLRAHRSFAGGATP